MILKGQFDLKKKNNKKKKRLDMFGSATPLSVSYRCTSDPFTFCMSRTELQVGSTQKGNGDVKCH